jgi:hypothetical protein
MDALSMLATSPSRARALGAIGAQPRSQRAPSTPPLPEEQKEAMMSALARQAGGALEVAGKVLDTPGAIARGVLAGDPLSGFSWDSDRRVTGKELLEQYGLLKPKDDPYFSTFAGLAAEIATDPFSIISGPANALTKAGKAAQAAGILNHAQDAALAAMGIDKARDTLSTGRNAYEFLGGLLPMGKAITKENAAYRPLVGPRVARSTTTLEETIKHARDPSKAMEGVKNYLSKQGIDYDAVKGQNLGGAAGLSYFGLIDPIVFNPKTPGVQKALDMLDAGGQAVRWSAPVRGASSVFDQRVGGRTSSYDQLMNLRHWDDLKAEEGAARVVGAKHASLVSNTVLSDEAQRILGAPTLNSEQGGDFLTRMWENVPTQRDMRLRAAIGDDKVRELVDSFDGVRNSIRTEADRLGMVSRKMKDMYGVEWSPRSAREADFRDYGRGLSKQTYYARSLQNEARQKYLMTPGGTVDLRQISLLPTVKQFVQEGEKSGLSIADVGAEIKKFLDYKHGADTPEARAYLQSVGMEYDPRATPFKTFVPATDAAGNVIKAPVLDPAGNALKVAQLDKRGNPLIDAATGQPVMVDKMKTVLDPNQAISQKQAEKIARFNMRKDLSLADTTPMFSEHPLVSQSRAIMGQAKARVNADEVYTSIGEAAMHAGFGKRGDMLPGTRLKSVDRALNEAAAKTGLKTSQKTGGASVSVQNIMRERIAAANNMSVDKVNLSEWAIPEHVLERLTAVNDFYSRPRTQDAVMNMFGEIGQIFKGFLLAFPSRFTRDIYSNGYQLWTMAKNPLDVTYGLNAASKIVGGDKAAASALLKQIPGYDKLSDAQRQAKLLDDVSRTGILQTLASNDLATANRTGELQQLVPGVVPQRGLDFVKELIPDGSRNPLQMVGDYFTFKGSKIPFLQKQAAPETRNAILNASQKLNDYVDSVSRLGGMLALMRQGIAPEEAARRVTEALVDYSSLTSVERSLFKTVFPWWSYSSRAGAYAVKQLATNPGGAYAQTLRGFNRLQESDKDTYVPEAMRQQFAVRVPDFMKPFLRIPEGTDTTTFLKDIDIPGHDVLSLLSPSFDPYHAAQSTFQNLAMQSNPLIQSGIELATNTDLFSRRPLRHSDSSIDRIYKGLSGSKTNMNPLVRQALELIPGPRVSGIFGGLMDERIPMDQRIAKTLVNTLTGVKLQTVDPAYQLADARRVLAQDLDPYMQDYTESYIPEDVLPQVPPELLPKYQLFKSLGKDMREIRKARNK